MSEKKIRVFISYAWESEEYRNSIWELGSWIYHCGNGEIDVVTDHLCSITPDPKGWDIWMLEQIKKADIVLSACSPKYYNSFIKRDGVETGGGVVYEATIITDELKNCKGINNKFYPILPDGVDRKFIPEILRPYSNAHCFHSGNKAIISLIRKENPSFGTAYKIEEEVVIKVQAEKQIVEEIESPEKDKMYSPIKILVRAYLSLNETDKLSIARAIGVNNETLKITPINARDLHIMKEVKDKNLLANLWNEINKTVPFEANTNPFN
jgi:hypothetical protein